MLGILASRSQDRIDTLISAGTRISGNVVFSGGLRIDGEVVGNVIATPGQPSVLVIGAGGRVRGEVRAARMVVNGVVAGVVHVSEMLELQPCARISGHVFYAAMEIHRGARIEAQLVREAPAAVDAAPRPSLHDPIEAAPLPVANAA
ncbi:MAG TPA: polymer-forming cytoskeletal protein [Burkholderiales bacterium]|nr:polymer-forming cytoskeletal protein [Burkholderiales bacterium]